MHIKGELKFDLLANAIIANDKFFVYTHEETGEKSVQVTGFIKKEIRYGSNVSIILDRPWEKSLPKEQRTKEAIYILNGITNTALENQKVKDKNTSLRLQGLPLIPTNYIEIDTYFSAQLNVSRLKTLLVKYRNLLTIDINEKRIVPLIIFIAENVNDKGNDISIKIDIPAEIKIEKDENIFLGSGRTAAAWGQYQRTSEIQKSKPEFIPTQPGEHPITDDPFGNNEPYVVDDMPF